MDFVSHGLWGGVVAGRRNRRDFWKAFSWGAMPDLIPFTPFFIERIYKMFTGGPSFVSGPPDISTIPQYVFNLYSVTHSYVTFLAVFIIMYVIYKRPYWLMTGWAIHITMDIFTHTTAFFPTPFLFPLSDYRFNGVSWSEWYILWPNIIILALSYLYFFVIRPRRQKHWAMKNEG
jgi:hypothetical protein